jgi:hypothetical protein
MIKSRRGFLAPNRYGDKPEELKERSPKQIISLDKQAKLLMMNGRNS